MMDNCSGMWRAAGRGLARCNRELGLSPLGLLGSPSRVNIYNPKILTSLNNRTTPLNLLQQSATVCGEFNAADDCIQGELESGMTICDKSVIRCSVV